VNPLDRPIWHALDMHLAHIATGSARAKRMQAPFGMFAAAADDSAESLAELAALVPRDGAILLLQAGSNPLPPGTAAQMTLPGVQMIARSLSPLEPDSRFRPLGPGDVAGMLELAALTQPGPFFERTAEIGPFWGAHEDGRLVAMAGERLRFGDYVEVSGVCTHPDFRGRGYAGLLSRLVATQILKQGKTPFLHAVSSNTSAIRLYEKLGFALRSEVTATVLVSAANVAQETSPSRP
jgi:predicted GNAT family acetyltransferase